MSVEFDTPANRIIAQQQPQNKFRIDTSLPDLTWLRQLSIQGRLRYFQQDLSSADLVVTPPTGETFFTYKAIIINAHATAAASLTMTNDGLTRYVIRLLSVANDVSPFEINLLDSLVGDGSKNMTWSQSSGTMFLSVLGWVENTSRIRDVAI